MPRLTADGRITVPAHVREQLGIEPGDEIAVESLESGYSIQPVEPRTATGETPFERYRNSASSGEPMPERMRRLRGEYPRGSDRSTADDRELVSLEDTDLVVTDETGNTRLKMSHIDMTGGRLPEDVY
ncbi:MAG: AbrB/MazE/SpoVT family DNA-binding domain-containing protein [Natrialbaceae archaeon]|nr:AbrB/MazE/SpoVT family DNA-binding domain-containing protein [Natrialbaceae archaeon]